MPINYATLRRISTDAVGNQANGGRYDPVFSPDGSRIAFTSAAFNLVPDDTNGRDDVFVKDLRTGAVTRASTNSSGKEGNGHSFDPTFSPDGARVAFVSSSSDLVAQDTNEREDVFVKDLRTGALIRVSSDSRGSQGDSFSFEPVFSPDGTRIAWSSLASNLVLDDTNDEWDLFIKELNTGEVIRASTDSRGREANAESYGPAFSPDGRRIAFTSLASNLTPNDTNEDWDVFVKDLRTGAVTRISTDARGREANGESFDPVFSRDGTRIAFASTASNLVPDDTNGRVDVFVKDLNTGAITRVSTDALGREANEDTRDPVFSPDGSKIAFVSAASNLVPGDTNGLVDVFLKDLRTGLVVRISADLIGRQANGASYAPVFSPDGATIAFVSEASNLVPNDTNGASDIFLVDLTQGGPGDDVLAPLFAGEEVLGGAGNDRFLGSPLADVFRPGPGSDRMFGGAGVDQYIGTPIELNGDRIEDFAIDDRIVLEGVRFDRRSLRVVPGTTTQLQIDSDGDGSFETTINLEGDFTGRRFLVEPSSSGQPTATAIRLAPEPNRPPVAADDSARTTYDKPVRIELIANDRDPEGILDPTSLLITSLPSSGRLENNRDGTVTFTPGFGFTGEVRFRYTVADLDGGRSNEAEVRILVDRPNQRPVANDDSVRTNVNTPVRIELLANDQDPDGALDPTSLVITAQPASGRLETNRDGTVTFTPASGFTGEVRFRYTVADRDGARSNEAEVRVLVENVQVIRGSAGSETLTGTSGADLIYALAGNDTVRAGAGDDRVSGREGRDRLFGDAGDDILVGGSDDDRLTGGAGNDILLGGLGFDTLVGGSGLDVAVYEGRRADYEVRASRGRVTVRALTSGEGTDSLSGIERIQFADGWIDTGGGRFVGAGFATPAVEALLTGGAGWID